MPLSKQVFFGLSSAINTANLWILWQKIYGKVIRPLPATTNKMEKSGLAMRDYYV